MTLTPEKEPGKYLFLQIFAEQWNDLPEAKYERLKILIMETYDSLDVNVWDYSSKIANTLLSQYRECIPHGGDQFFLSGFTRDPYYLFLIIDNLRSLFLSEINTYANLIEVDESLIIDELSLGDLFTLAKQIDKQMIIILKERGTVYLTEMEQKELENTPSWNTVARLTKNVRKRLLEIFASYWDILSKAEVDCLDTENNLTVLLDLLSNLKSRKKAKDDVSSLDKDELGKSLA